MINKHCPKCDTPKAVEHFSRNASFPDGRSAWCKVCMADYQRNRRSTPEGREVERAWNVRHRETRSNYKPSLHLLRRYGLTIEDYEAMLKAQSGGCAICKATSPGGRGRFHVDHCHATGQIRGLLCARCNLRLGYYEAVHSDAGFKTYLSEAS